MKKKLIIIILSTIILTLNSCAKPKVVEIAQSNDKKMSCEELEEEIADAEKVKSDAEYAKTGTGGNMTRLLLFWPAWARSLSNADKAIIAANDRIYHLNKIMKNKNCEEANNDNNISNSTNSVADQLKAIKEMYKSGDLTKEEYKKAKEKILK